MNNTNAWFKQTKYEIVAPLTRKIVSNFLIYLNTIQQSLTLNFNKPKSLVNPKLWNFCGCEEELKLKLFYILIFS